MPRASISANPRKDFHVVAIHQVHAPLGIQLHQFLGVRRINSPVVSTGLPSVHRVVTIFLLLNPHTGLRKKVHPAHVIPVRVADDDVRPPPGLPPRRFHRLVGPQIILHRKILQKSLAMKTAVEKDRMAPAPNQPHHHRDFDFLALRPAHHQFRHWHVRHTSVTYRLNRILRRRGSSQQRTKHSQDQKGFHVGSIIRGTARTSRGKSEVKRRTSERAAPARTINQTSPSQSRAPLRRPQSKRRRPSRRSSPRHPKPLPAHPSNPSSSSPWKSFPPAARAVRAPAPTRGLSAPAPRRRHIPH